MDRRALTRPDARTYSHTHARYTRTLARFANAVAFNEDLSGWNTSAVTTMMAMWVLTSTDACLLPDTLTVAICIAHSPGSNVTKRSISPLEAGTRAR